MGIQKTSLLVLKLHLDSLEGYPILKKIYLMCSLGNSYAPEAMSKIIFILKIFFQCVSCISKLDSKCKIGLKIF